MESTDEGFRPPYMSFQTFWNFIDELAAKPLPPRVDRSIMTSKSGTDQANLILALTSFALTDGEGHVQPALTRLVGIEKDQRAKVFGDMIKAYYVEPLRVSAENGTTNDLNRAFAEGYTSIASPDTRRKAITFFLHAARNAGIELSPHFPPTRSGQGAPGVPKAKRGGPRKTKVNGGGAVAPPIPPSTPTPVGGHSQTVTLQSGGSITLTYDVNMFEISDADEAFVLDLIKKLRTYRSGASANDDEGSGDGAS